MMDIKLFYWRFMFQILLFSSQTVDILHQLRDLDRHIRGPGYIVPAHMIIHPPVITEVRQLNARRPPRVLGAINMCRRDLDPDVRRKLRKVEAKAVCLIRQLVDIVLQVVGIVPQPLALGYAIKVVQHRALRLHKHRRPLVQLMRPLRHFKPQVLEHGQRQAAADEDGRAERQGLLRGLLCMVQQVAADEGAAL